MDIKSSLFYKSMISPREAPQDRPSFAMIGRSNVGKSSLINALLHRKNLARTSVVPGKTRLINYFLINEAWYLVDLPGYGWAQVSRSQRMLWVKMIKAYLTQTSLQTIFLLIDGRHPLQAIDRSLMAWLRGAKLPYAVVVTKADKCSSRVLTSHIQGLNKALQEDNILIPPVFVTSSKNRNHPGLVDLLGYIEAHLDDYRVLPSLPRLTSSHPRGA